MIIKKSPIMSKFSEKLDKRLIELQEILDDREEIAAGSRRASDVSKISDLNLIMDNVSN